MLPLCCAEASAAAAATTTVLRMREATGPVAPAQPPTTPLVEQQLHQLTAARFQYKF